MGNGNLFSEYFLHEGITTMPGWSDIDADRIAQARTSISAFLSDFDRRRSPNESETEDDLIQPILSLLGWNDFLTQQTASKKGRSDVPDYLLFPSDSAKRDAAPLSAADKYALGVSLLEAKAWGVDLDKANNQTGEGAPATQLLRYLGNIGPRSNDSIRYGLLTNGSVWRLYDNKARSRLEGYVEIDLHQAVGATVPPEKPDDADAWKSDADRLLRTFLWLFSRTSFLPDAGGETPIKRAIRESRAFEARVTNQLADTVFDSVFPQLASALASADTDRPDELDEPYLEELREAALTWLYRLLFTLYAEDRRLLPTRARTDGLWATRKIVARALDSGEALSTRRTNYDGDLRALWDQINEGDTAVGIPPYNGGLFKPARASLLRRATMSDADFAPLLDALSRERTGDRPRFINYRDLDVQHLGSVYERLLEYDLAQDTQSIVARPQTFARKTSGSYYTPEDLVMLVIRRTVGPLLEERRQTFADAVATEAKSKQACDNPVYPLARLAEHDPATAFLDLRICDPAMGSGHFLVSLVDYLADQVMIETQNAHNAVEFGDYVSPLLPRLDAIRETILANAKDNGWAVHPAQLENDKLVRRIILKRVIHGVDKNPMAVELAKLSLWLHTFTVGAPLSFLDHHLRCGDSLFGEWLRPAMDRLGAANPLFTADMVRDFNAAVSGMGVIESLSDADIGEVQQSATLYDEMRTSLTLQRDMLSLLQGYRWIEGSQNDARKLAKKLERDASRITDDVDRARELNRKAWELKRQGQALELLVERQLGDPQTVLDLCYGRIGTAQTQLQADDPAMVPLEKAADIARTSNFLHWELAFPNVWQDPMSSDPGGGFDAVIGNPPWDRLKMQEVEWFASRRDDIAHATRAADRKRMIAKLKRDGDPLSSQYDRASEMAKLAAGMATRNPKDGGQYPLLGKGDVNLYSLFVERAQRLVSPGGLVGLLVPSGISGDLSASEFFRSVSTTGRLGSLLDYANRPLPGGSMFFDDVDSRLKFSVLTFGRREGQFKAAECGFFLSATDDEALAKVTFPLAPTDFSAVNPNSGTAPVFRTPRDADLTTAIYARIPVLIDHRADPPARVFPVRYMTMFHMTNDSDKFLTAAELEAERWYPVKGGRWQKGDAEAMPLYVGRMFNQFDHRAAGVEVNKESLHNAASSARSTDQEKADPLFLPMPQYWVDRDHISPNLTWALAFRDIARPTDVRTVISAILPSGGYGNKAPLLLIDQADQAALLCANLNSMALDFVARQKIQSANLNLYIVEQLPIVPPAAYDRTFGILTARDIVQREILNLTYTAHNMAPFARDMGYVDDAGEVKLPFVWEEADRRQRRARLDALYFHLYGINHDDADYILSTFPIVRRHDERDFGRYLTRDLILAQMSALEAGDPDAIIDLR